MAQNSSASSPPPDNTFSRAPRRRATATTPPGSRRQQPRPDLVEPGHHPRPAHPPITGTGNRPERKPIPVPADAVTAQASGLDPHISLRNAELQAPRVAKSPQRQCGKKFWRLSARTTDPASLGLLGEPGVNVLELNLALDSLK